MEFRLLGRLEVRDRGREIRLGRGKQKSLLAVLLLHAGEVVPTERLIDALWGERPPRSAPNSVHIYVSQLRRALGDGRLVTHGRGYALELEPGEVDVERFERLLARGRELLGAGDARPAAETLREALSVWRGPPLADFAYEQFAQGEIARLEALRLAAHEERIESDLRLGRHAQLVPELEALVREEPLRERLRALLMLALYGCGRQADALEAYHDARRTLVEELALEPGPDLQELERAILRHDPALAPATRPRPTRPARRRGGVYVALGGALLLTVAAAGFALLRDDASVISVRPEALAFVDAKSEEVAAVTAVGAPPSAVAAGSDAVWVANTQNSVSRIDPRTQSVRQTIHVGGDPADVAVTDGAVWVANGLDGTVSRIDPESNLVVQTVAVGNGPTGLAAGAGAVWVTNSADGTVSRIDPESGRVTRTVPAAVGASGVAVGFGRLWVASPPLGSIAVLNPRSGQVLQRIGVGTDPEAVTAGSGSIWVANRTDGTVSKIDPRRGVVIDTIRIGHAATGVAAGYGRVWVADAADGTLSRVDPSSDTIVTTVRLGNPPQDLALSPQGVYVGVRSTGREHRGGAIRVASALGPRSVDLASTDACWCASILTNDGLVGFRRVSGVRGTQLVPDLAISLPAVSDGGKRYTFRVRRGVRYSTGAPVLPDDFRRAIERFFEARPGTERVPYYDGIIGADRCSKAQSCDLSRGIVVDRSARTVSFRLGTPDPDFLFKLALPFAFAVPAGAPAHDVGTHPLPATGPYRIAAFSPTTHTLYLQRNRRFREWAADAQPDGYPDAISWSWRFGTTFSAVRAVERGSADVALFQTAPRKSELARLATRYPARLHMSTQPHTAYFFLNTRVPPFDDPEVRRAVNDAFDRDAFVRILGRAFAPTCQILPPNLPGYRRTCPYAGGGIAGLDAARRRVRRSGTRQDAVTVWVGSATADQGRYMVSVLDRIGYRARLKVVRAADPRVYFAKILDPQVRVQVGYWAWAAEFPSALDMIQPEFGCPVPQLTSNPSAFCDPQIDAEIQRAAALQARDPSAANVRWQRIEREILAQAPVVPTSNRRNVDFVSKRVRNYAYNPQWGVLLDQLWVK
jgi:peptide/nickel transport system substrate-binding protein